MDIKHSQLPWRLAQPGDPIYVTGTDTICTADGQRSICDIIGGAAVDGANASLIVRACNNFGALAEALRNAKAEIISEIDPNTSTAILLNEIDGVLADAGEELI